MCVGCRGRALIGELLRVVAVDGRLVVDERRRRPGRGAWLHTDPGCLESASRRRAFPRALRVPGPLDAEAVGEYLRGRLASVPHHSSGAGSPASCREERKQVDPS
ncbi:YlxR family protein [Haloechinothrix sp. YIM 98757]|uniref:YlxR family protein n=1 Tax=Haloechinothrix aidingensis TaxID=2752311 RepID=A0A838A0T3_9PSEU|nr:YlxR family protein [Haloechinothrix aidingensis]MBA0126174.1 YlxR family protein [Haloechinothrix aidingensis]